MTYAVGVLLMALGIGASIALHEAGHLVSAKRFGMRATRYFIGFGPTLWSFRRGGTEYGVKAVPAGGFVKIEGMTPDEEVEPHHRPYAFWRQPIGRRTAVLAAGSLTHFLLAGVLFYLAAVWTGLPNPAYARAVSDPSTIGSVIGKVYPCIIAAIDRSEDTCRPSDPVSPARRAGLQVGDRIVAVGDTTVRTYEELVKAVRSTPADRPVSLTYVRDGQRRTATVQLVSVERTTNPSGGAGKRQTVSALGVGAPLPPARKQYGPLGAIPASAQLYGDTVVRTFRAIGSFPSKIPPLIDSLTGAERDPTTPVSVVGVSQLGGEAAEQRDATFFLGLLATLNVFVGVFNLFPLLPLDGGHIAIAWYERARSAWARRRGRPDPGRVDYANLLPLTYLVIIVFGGISLLTITADVLNPITLSP